ncbi:type VI secretion system contractile sheath large subunit [Pseudomonas sp. NPDC090755]|uniref:type VI secretion system contractile sheath large subunit n=1 Tax=Pseudomonas sp. NPDC090755 TaxID=3364481 RepID=UPI003839DEE8
MSVEQSSTVSRGAEVLPESNQGVYAALFDKINLSPVAELEGIDDFQNEEALSEVSAEKRVTASVSVFLELLNRSSRKVERLDRALLDMHIAALDAQISRQLDAVMHHCDFQRVESTWRGVKSLIDQTDFRKNVRIELLDISKHDLALDFDDAPEIAQSGLYLHTYTHEYDTPGGEPIAAAISNYDFDCSPQDVALLGNISRVSAAAHMPFVGAVGPAFFGKQTMEQVAAIKDIGNYFDRAEYIKWKAFRDSDDARYIGLTMPRVLGRLPYGPDTVAVRSFNYIESVSVRIERNEGAKQIGIYLPDVEFAAARLLYPTEFEGGINAYQGIRQSDYVSEAGKRAYDWKESQWTEAGWTLIRRVEGEFIEVPERGFFPRGEPGELYSWPEREAQFSRACGEKQRHPGGTLQYAMAGGLGRGRYMPAGYPARWLRFIGRGSLAGSAYPRAGVAFGGGFAASACRSGRLRRVGRWHAVRQSLDPNSPATPGQSGLRGALACHCQRRGVAG